MEIMLQVEVNNRNFLWSSTDSVVELATSKRNVLVRRNSKSFRIFRKGCRRTHGILFSTVIYNLSASSCLEGLITYSDTVTVNNQWIFC